MTASGAITQKIKGKLQKVKGNIHQSMGQDVKGALEKFKGSVNETVADMRIQHGQRQRSRTRSTAITR